MTARTYARMVAGTVMEIVQTSAAIDGLYHPGIRWADITGNAVQVGWVRIPSAAGAPAGTAIYAAPAVPPVPSPPAPSLPVSIADLQAELSLLAARVAALKGAAANR